jgi:hypothetical protein
MDIISRKEIIDLIKHCEGLAITIYMPTYEAGRRKEQSPIRLKNLLNQATDQMSETGMGKGEINSYLNPIENLLDDEFFWQQQTEGLALFLDANELHLYHLPDRVEESLLIGNHYHITPLIPIYQGNGQYYLLQIDQERPKIMQGSKFHLDEVDEVNLPESLQEMFDSYFEFHSHLSFHTSTSSPNPDSATQRNGIFFSQSGGDDIEKEAEIRNFFHRFDDALMEYLGGHHTPLVLAGADYLHHSYRQANSYPNLLEKGITKKVDQMPVEDLHKLSWQIVQEKFEKDFEQALEAYHQKEVKNGETSTEIEKIVPAAYYQQIHTLFSAENVQLWGKFKPDENLVLIKKEPSTHNEDLINLAATHTLTNGGEVLVVPQEKIPNMAKLAAIFRYSE